MMTIKRVLAGVCMLAFVGVASAQDFYYRGDSAVALSISEEKIVVQLNSTSGAINVADLFASHSCLDAGHAPKHIARGFYEFRLREGFEHAAAVADLKADASVNRVLPVYLTPDFTELKVADLVSFRLAADVPTESALALLERIGLHFSDSSKFVHGKWQARLDDTLKGSPLEFANLLYRMDETVWALPTFYSSPKLCAEPGDRLYQYQYYLKNTGGMQGQLDNDIDADSAWLIPLPGPAVKVAVIDGGIASHIDLPADRILPGYSVIGPGTPDNVAPADSDYHGMAVAGILAASHNDTGVVGVAGSCLIVPIRMFYRDLQPSDDAVADAIDYAVASQAKVISCSWGWDAKSGPFQVEEAIETATDTSESSTVAFTRTFVFGAGNNGQNEYPPNWRWVGWPSRMDEVLAVGGMDKNGSKWPYSAPGAALDVMAPCGNAGLCMGDQWTADQMGGVGQVPWLCGHTTEDIWDDFTSFFGGTSGACPQVSGIAALILARRPDFDTGSVYRHHNTDTTHLIIQSIIKNSAENIGAPGWDDSTGFGRANAYRALLSVIHGDMDNDGFYTFIDLGKMIDYLFACGDPPVLQKCVADLDCDGWSTALDMGHLIDILGAGAPFPSPCFIYY